MKKLAGVLALLFAATRCASSGGQDTDSISVISSPTGAVATALDQRITTPGHFVVPASVKEVEIRVEMRGYESVTVLVTREVDNTAYKRCLKAIGLEPPTDKPPPKGGGTTSPEGTGLAISEAVSRAIEECSRKTSSHLSKTHVFVKLEPLPGTLTSPRN